MCFCCLSVRLCDCVTWQYFRRWRMAVCWQLWRLSATSHYNGKDFENCDKENIRIYNDGLFVFFLLLLRLLFLHFCIPFLEFIFIRWNRHLSIYEILIIKKLFFYSYAFFSVTYWSAVCICLHLICFTLGRKGGRKQPSNKYENAYTHTHFILILFLLCCHRCRFLLC